MAQIDTNKFEKVFSSIEKQLVMQSSFLESMYNMQVGQIAIEKERDKDQKRLLDILSVKDTATTSERIAEPEITPDENDEEEVSNGIGKFLGMALVALQAFSFRNIASTLIRGGLALAIAEPLGSFVSGVVTQALDEMSLSPTVSSLVGEGIGSAIEWGVIGSIFGKRIALLFGVGGLLGETIGNIIGANEADIYSAFGLAFSQQDMINIGSILGVAFGPSLLRSAFNSEVLEGADTDSPRLRSRLQRSFSRGFRLVGWGAAIAGIGELLAIGITNATGSESLGDVASWTGYGASIGSVFGPAGTVIGAIAGLAIGGGNFLIDYLNNVRDNAADDIKAEIDRLEGEAQAALRERDTAAASNAMDMLARQYLSLGTSEEYNATRQQIEDSAAELLQELGAIDPEAATNLEEEWFRVISARIREREIPRIGYATPENIDATVANLTEFVEKSIPAVISNFESLSGLTEAQVLANRPRLEAALFGELSSSGLVAGNDLDITPEIVKDAIDEYINTTNARLSTMSDNALIARIQAMSAIPAGQQSSPVMLNTGGNVSRAGDVYNDYSQVINMMGNAATALSSYNQFNLNGVQ